MTTKHEVDFDKYRKPPRLLAQAMEDALAPGGDLHPVLIAVENDARLRLDIRDRRFNVYYAGGNLMCVDGRNVPWGLHFDAKYFKGGTLQPPTLPSQFTAVEHAYDWVRAFPELVTGMDDWWSRHPKGERAHCQAMAATNAATDGLETIDYLILDLEYQWAQRRFDMIAAKRKPSEKDAVGWTQPDFVFIEVKSVYSACCGKAGLGDHARDYRDIVSALNGQSVRDIKLEFENVFAQKTRLGLLDTSLGFERFSNTTPELLIVFVDLAVNAPKLVTPLDEVRAVSDALGDLGRIRLIQLDSPDYLLSANTAISPQQLIENRS